MEKLYERINFENTPSKKTPLNEENLNKMDGAIDKLDNRTIEFDSLLMGFGMNAVFDGKLKQGYWDTDNKVYTIVNNPYWVSSESAFQCVPGDKLDISFDRSIGKIGFVFWNELDSMVAYVNTEYKDSFSVVAPKGATKFTFMMRPDNNNTTKPSDVGNIVLLKNCEINAIKESVGSLEEDVESLKGNYTGTGINTLNPVHEFDEKLQQIGKGKYGEEENTLTILHFSDLHNNTENLNRVIEFYNQHGRYIDDIIHTGDGVTHYGSENPFSVVGGNTIMNVIGNHECWIEGDTAPMPYNATATQVYQKFFAPFISDWGVISAGENLCYYYKDYETAKVRMVVIDCMHFDSAQETWLLNTLEDARAKEYSIVGVTHYPPQTGMEAIDCTFASIDQTPKGATPGEGYQIERTPEAAYTSVDIFINNGGDFICWICGHTHYDHIGTVSGHTNQICIVINTAKVDSYGDELRKHGTKTQDCFNVIAFDRNSKLIKIVRVGASYDRHLRSKKTLCLNYNTGGVISNT